MVHIKMTLEQNENSRFKCPMPLMEYMWEVVNQETPESMSEIYGVEDIEISEEGLFIEVRPEMLMTLVRDFALANQILKEGG